MSVLLLISLVRASAQATGYTNGLSEDVLAYPYCWTIETNGIRAGVYGYAQKNEAPVSIIVLGSVSNESRHYLAPPGHKLLKVELKDAKGVPVLPKSSIKKLQGPTPAQKPIRDFPMTSREGLFFGRSAMFKDPLMLVPRAPYPLTEFNLYDYFSVKDDGTYSLTVWPAVYHFGTNAINADRVDLPPITIPIRLLSQNPP